MRLKWVCWCHGSHCSLLRYYLQATYSFPWSERNRLTDIHNFLANLEAQPSNYVALNVVFSYRLLQIWIFPQWLWLYSSISQLPAAKWDQHYHNDQGDLPQSDAAPLFQEILSASPVHKIQNFHCARIHLDLCLLHAYRTLTVLLLCPHGPVGDVTTQWNSNDFWRALLWLLLFSWHDVRVFQAYSILRTVTATLNQWWHSFQACLLLSSFHCRTPYISQTHLVVVKATCPQRTLGRYSTFVIRQELVLVLPLLRVHNFSNTEPRCLVLTVILSASCNGTGSVFCTEEKRPKSFVTCSEAQESITSPAAWSFIDTVAIRIFWALWSELSFRSGYQFRAICPIRLQP